MTTFTEEAEQAFTEASIACDRALATNNEMHKLDNMNAAIQDIAFGLLNLSRRFAGDLHQNRAAGIDDQTVRTSRNRPVRSVKRRPRPQESGALQPAPKLRGAGLTTFAALSSISITARPRSFVPSSRKRNTPSAPLKPEMLVSAA